MRPYLFLAGAAMGVAVMAVLRKQYQKTAGTALPATLFFSCLSSFAAFFIGLVISGGFTLEPVSFALACAYAFLCTGTAMLCIVAAKYGSVSVTILYGTMGTLVLPSIFGLLFDPADSITFSKICGFLFALLALSVGFLRSRSQPGMSREGRWLPLVIFFTNGLALVVFKLLFLLRPEYPQSAFVTLYMLISALATLILLVIFALKGRAEHTPAKKPSPAVLAITLSYAAAFFLSDYLSLNCTAVLPLTVQAPLSFCLPILCTALLEWVLYRQKFGRYDFYQITFAILCSICFVLP